MLSKERHQTATGPSGFKASQVIVENLKVAKVVFVVDGADLNYQTTKEFNFFSLGSVDGMDDTTALVDQIELIGKPAADAGQY